MTAPLHAFDGQAVYLDTMMFYALLRGIEPSAKTFFARIESGAFSAYTSALTFDELTYRLVLALVKDAYGGSPLDHLRDHEEGLLREFAPKVTAQLSLLYTFPHLILLDVSVSDLPVMNEVMIRHQLRPRDGLHVAALRRVGCVDIASTDPHFDRVPGLRRFVF